MNVKGRIIGIRQDKWSSWITLEIDEYIMDRLDKVFDLYSGRDIHDKISGIKNYHSHRSWRWIEGVPIGSKNDGTCYLIFKWKAIAIVLLHNGNYKKTFNKILEYFEFRNKK